MTETINTIISFQASDEYFCFDAMNVRNILELGKITKIPNAPPFMVGLINLHGNIIPIADFRIMIGIENPVNTKNTSIIVVTPDGTTQSYIGFIVDMVNEVITVQSSQLTENIIEGIGMVNSFDGTYNFENLFIHLINLDSLITRIEEFK